MKDSQKAPIWIFTLGYPGQDGGIAVYAQEVASGLYRAGEEVMVLAGNVNPDDVILDQGSPFTILRFPRVRNKLCNLFFRFRVLVTAWRMREPRFVIATEWFSAGIVVWVLSHFIRLPYIVVAHGNEILRCKGRLMLRWLLAHVLTRAERVVAVSRYTQHMIEELVEGLPVNFIPNGVSLESVRSNRGPENLLKQLGLHDEQIILSLGRLIQRKGHDMVLEALPTVLEAFPEAIWLIAGKGSYQSILQQKIRAMGLRDHVRLLGYIDKADKGDYFRLSDVYVLVSRTIESENEVEGFGITYLEASACKIPIVAGRSGGVEDAVVDGVTGILVDPYSPPAIAKAIIRLLSDKEYARRLGENGYQRAVQQYSWDGYVSRLRDAVPEHLWKL